MVDSELKDQNNDDENTVVFHYIKNPLFRQVHIDGFYGGLTPSGFININFYGERPPVPKSSEHILDKDGNLGEEKFISEDSLDGIIREIELGGYMNIKAAEKLVEFLSEKIELYNRFVGSTKS